MNTYADKLAAALSYLGSKWQMHPEYNAAKHCAHPRISSGFEEHKWRTRRTSMEY